MFNYHLYDFFIKLFKLQRINLNYDIDCHCHVNIIIIILLFFLSLLNVVTKLKYDLSVLSMIPFTKKPQKMHRVKLGIGNPDWCLESNRMSVQRNLKTQERSLLKTKHTFI